MVKRFVPELNLWINNISYNNSFGYTYVSNPVLLSDFWLCRDSIIDMLFNETFDPSGTYHEQYYPFIYKYQKCNLQRITDNILLSRLQIYRNIAEIYAADDENKFSEVFNMVVPTNSYNTPQQIQFSEYVSFDKNIIHGTGSDQIYQELDPDWDPSGSFSDEFIVEMTEENIFGFDSEELEMCRLLYLYRIGKGNRIVPFSDDMYIKLQSPLSKWIYMYLQCYVFNTINHNYLNSICKIEDGILRNMFERHAQDRIYQYIQKQYMMIYNEFQNTGNGVQRGFTDYTLMNRTKIIKTRLNSDMLGNKAISLFHLTNDENKQPSENKYFEFIYMGIIQKQDVDYEVVETGDEVNPRVIIKLLSNKYQLHRKVQFMWGYIYPESPYSVTEGFKK